MSIIDSATNLVHGIKMLDHRLRDGVHEWFFDIRGTVIEFHSRSEVPPSYDELLQAQEDPLTGIWTKRERRKQ